MLNKNPFLMVFRKGRRKGLENKGQLPTTEIYENGCRSITFIFQGFQQLLFHPNGIGSLTRYEGIIFIVPLKDPV